MLGGAISVKSILHHEKAGCSLNGRVFWFTLARSEFQASSVLSGEGSVSEETIEPDTTI